MSAKRSKSKTALRGAVNNIIMESLIDGEKYGYEIIKEVETKTNGKIKLKQPSLYSSLKRFETKGYIESHWQDSDIGGKRHYYKLTPEGIAYYKKYIAKEIEDDFEDIDEEVKTNAVDEDEYLEDKLTTYEIDEHEEVNDLTKYEYNVDDKINSLLENDEEILDELYKEIEDDSILYSEEDIENEYREQESIISDHDFTPPTPLEVIEQENKNEIKNKNYSSIIKDEDISKNALDDILEKESDDIFDDIDLNKTYEVEKIDKKENKEQSKIITDSDGITKMYYDDEVVEPKKNNKVFDNVVYRTTTQDIYSNLSKRPSKEEPVLSDEEKELKSKRFFEKFDSKSEQIMKEKQQYKSSVAKQEPEETKIDYNYKSKLNSLFDTQSIEDESFEAEEIYNNDDIDDDQYISEYQPDENEDVFNFNGDTTKNVKSDYNMKIYTEEKSKTPTNKYLQVNKAKFVFGLTMLLFMLIQVTVMLIVLKNKSLLADNQYWVFQMSYTIIGIVALFYCVPVFISPSKQASNTFKLNYSLIFGALAFFIIVILTYAINTFMGMEMFNLKYYLATLVVPITLSLNFIMGPIIYWIITQNKKFY